MAETSSLAPVCQAVLLVESSIEALKAEAIALQVQVRELENEVERLQAQLSILLPTLNGMVDDKVRLAVLDRVPELVERALRDRDRNSE